MFGSKIIQRYGDQVLGELVREHESIQVGPGAGETRVTTRIGHDLVLQRLQVEPEMITRLVPDEEWAFVTVGLAWRGTRLFNGKAVEPHDCCVTVSSLGYETSCADRDIITAAIRKQRLRGAIAALSGRPVEAVELGDTQFNLGAEAGLAFQNLLLHLLMLSGEKLNIPALISGSALENDVIECIAQSVAAHSRQANTADWPERSPRLVVQRALEASADLSRPHSISDLCAAAEVGESYLHKCFIDILNTSPARVLRMRRLTAARKRFLEPHAPPVPVKSVATSLGFVEPGRFAQYYRNTFGELPSDTIQRVTSQKTVGRNGAMVD